MARQRFRMAVSCRDLRRCLCLPISTFQDTRLRYRAPACSVTALPRAAPFDRTTLHAASFSLAGLTTDNSEMLRLEIAGRVRQWFFHGALEANAGRQTICNWDQAAVPQSSCH